MYSWRKMAAEIYGGEVAHGVLQRIATDDDYIPADGKILRALDILKKPNPYRMLPRWFKRIPEALEYYEGKRARIRFLSQETRKKLL